VTSSKNPLILVRLLTALFILNFFNSCKSGRNAETKTIEFSQRSSKSIPNIDNFCSSAQISQQTPKLINWLLGFSKDEEYKVIITNYKASMHRHLVQLLYSRIITAKYPQFGSNPRPTKSKSALIGLVPEACNNLNHKSFYETGVKRSLRRSIRQYFSKKRHVKYFFDAYQNDELMDSAQNSCLIRSGNFQDNSSETIVNVLRKSLGDLCNDPESVENYLRNPVAIVSLIEAEESDGNRRIVKDAKAGYCAYTKYSNQEAANYNSLYRKEIMWTLPVGIIGASATFVGALVAAMAAAIPSLGTSAAIVPAAGVGIELSLFAATWGPRYFRLSEKVERLEGLKRMNEFGLPTGCDSERMRATILELENMMVADWIGLFVGGAIAAFLPPGGPAIHVSLRELFISGFVRLNPLKIIKNARGVLSVKTLRSLKSFPKRATRSLVDTLTDGKRLYARAQVTAAYGQKAMTVLLLGIFGNLAWTSVYEESKGIDVDVESLEGFKTDSDLEMSFSFDSLDPIVLKDVVSSIDGYSDKFKELLINIADSEILKSVVSHDILAKLRAKADSNSLYISRIFKKFMHKIIGKQSVFSRIPTTADIVEVTSAITGNTYRGHAVETFKGGVHVVFLYQPSYKNKKINIRVFPASDILSGSAKILNDDCSKPNDLKQIISESQNEFLLKMRNKYLDVDSKLSSQEKLILPEPVLVSISHKGKKHSGLLWMVVPFVASDNPNVVSDHIAFINFSKIEPVSTLNVDSDGDMMILYSEFVTGEYSIERSLIHERCNSI